MDHLLSDKEQARLERFARALVDQTAARVIVPPQQPTEGFWFGGGNLVDDGQGNLLLVGRYRNAGDSRTGLGLGERGLELAIFQSPDRGRSFEKLLSFTKADLTVDDFEVLSIEGSALLLSKPGDTGPQVELFVSTEKAGLGYPAPWSDYLKPGAGRWTIDCLAANSIAGLKQAPLRMVLRGDDPQVMHVKDPLVHREPGGDLALLFCTHPFNWSSSNSALAVRRSGQAEFERADYTFFPRGFTWDVAISRITCVLDVPPVGPFADRRISLVFYDGGESLRDLDQHSAAVRRPRGYSCEELGGAAYVVDGRWREIRRLSRYQPWFVSPHGTGCSRYVDVLAADDGYYATWQQSQADRSQPLVLNTLTHEAAESILSGD